MAKSQRHSSEERWIIKHGTLYIKWPLRLEDLKDKEIRVYFPTFRFAKHTFYTVYTGSRKVGSISAVSRVRAHFPEKRLVIEPKEKKHARFFFTVLQTEIFSKHTSPTNCDDVNDVGS